MIGAREYAKLFETGQYDKMYIVSGSHSVGRTFRIFVLPYGEEAIGNGTNNAPLNKSAVEVYGITAGRSGSTEIYGWIHEGRWQLDFQRLVADKKAIIEENKNDLKEKLKILNKAKQNKINDTLLGY